MNRIERKTGYELDEIDKMTNLLNVLSTEIKNPSLFLEDYTYRNQINYQTFSILS
jgi:hypothetical protein